MDDLPFSVVHFSTTKSCVNLRIMLLLICSGLSNSEKAGFQNNAYLTTVCLSLLQHYRGTERLQSASTVLYFHLNLYVWLRDGFYWYAWDGRNGDTCAGAPSFPMPPSQVSACSLCLLDGTALIEARIRVYWLARLSWYMRQTESSPAWGRRLCCARSRFSDLLCLIKFHYRATFLSSLAVFFPVNQ